MFEAKAEKTFKFVSCIEVKELLSKKALDEAQLLDLLEEVPLDSIFFHTHGYFLRHRYLTGLYRNDFANWAAEEVGDRILGEKLGALDPHQFGDIEGVRSALIDILDAHLSKRSTVPGVSYGEPFHFMQSKIVEVPTQLRARTLREFRDGMSKVHVGALFYHIFEAKLRREMPAGDFRAWIEEEIKLPELAEQIGRLDPYMHSLESLRQRIVSACDEVLGRDRM